MAYRCEDCYYFEESGNPSTFDYCNNHKRKIEDNRDTCDDFKR